jgi:predicted transcriptional regulator
MKFKYDEILISLRIFLSTEFKKYKFSNKDISEVLGITPAAISQYLKGKRGKKYDKVIAYLKNNSNTKLLVNGFINDILKRRELKLPLTEFYFINLVNDVYSSLTGVKVAEEVKKVKLKTEQIKAILKERINLEIEAAQKCLNMASLVKDEFLKLLLRMIASDSIRHADILSMVLAKLEGKIEIEYEKLSKDFVMDMLRNEIEAKEISLKETVNIDYPIVSLLLESIDLDEEKHATIIKKLQDLS